jgi:cytochrome c oxidase subunit 3
MASGSDQSTYYVPENGWYPVWVALGVFLLLGGLGVWLNDVKAGEQANPYMSLSGLLVLAVVLFMWFGRVIQENNEGYNNAQVNRSYVWGMGWFIFSEVMFFAAFFGALFYARVFVLAWLGGEGDKALTGEYLWPDFKPVWPVMTNPNPEVFPGPHESMASPGIGGWGGYLPFWNTVILLSSSVTVHFAHTAIKDKHRGRLLGWLGLTILLGILFLTLQGYEYHHAYEALGLTLHSGIYGSTFFLLTGFHGFHVTLGTFILAVQLVRATRGAFSPTDCFGFEAASWYWHFVDVVWLCLFFFVYVL